MYPTIRDIADALLTHIYETGGAQFQVASNSTYEPLADIFQSTRDERRRSRDDVLDDGKTESYWSNKVQWARNELRKQGYLAPSAWGKWKLSNEGMSAARRVKS